MRITILGTGYVGLVTGTCLADLGHNVVCVDLDAARIERLRAGEVPIHEPGLPELVAKNIAASRLQFHTEAPKADVVVVAVGTPPGPDGAADLSHLQTAVDQAARLAPLVVIRSTVPPGTGDAMQARIGAATLVNAPEFLAEGTAVRDFQVPDRIVVGGPPDAAEAVLALFADLPGERVVVDRPTAELIKYASNTFLAARVSLINEIANLCDVVGADVRELARGVGMDPRIGPHFLRAGIGYGGSCFPKDVQALAAVARARGVAMPVVDAVEQTNRAQWKRVVDLLRDALGELRGKRIAFWGIAFKPGTDDTREAPGLKIMAALEQAGATVLAHDPVARFDGQAATALEAATGADALVHVTEWPEYQDVAAGDVKAALAGDLVVDGRNALDAPAYRAAGLRFVNIGANGGA